MSTDSPPGREQQATGDESNSSFYRTHPRLMFAAIPVTLLVFGFLFFVLYGRIDDTPPDDDTVIVPPVAPVVDAGNGKGDEEKMGDSSPEDAGEANEDPTIAPSLLAVRKSQLGRLQSRLRQVKSNWDKLNAVADEWHSDLRKRLAGDDGRKMAADRYLVERYMAINELERMPQADIADLEKQLGQFGDSLDATEAVIENATWDAHEELVDKELETLDKEIDEAFKAYEEHVLMVKVLLGQADGLQPDRLSLTEVIDEIEDEKERTRIDRIKRAREATEETHTQVLEFNAKKRKELEDEVNLLKDQAETDRRAADARDRKAQTDHDEKMRKDAEEKTALARQFELEFSAIERYLTPFTSEGYTQPTGRTYERRTTKGPVSYKSLLGAGVLGEDRDSVGRFYYGTVSGGNDRELGAFPPHSFSSGHFERHYETILKVQAFLRKFGPVMAEKNILAP